MIKTYSQKLTPPYSGQIQIAESETYRALTLDGRSWEIQYVNRTHVRVGTFSSEDIRIRSNASETLTDNVEDARLVELFEFLADVTLPFPAKDRFEFWLLDSQEKEPLALIFSCSSPEQMKKFPSRAEWTALPDAVMPIAKTEQEIADNAPPINYRLESLVSERAGTTKRAQWFDRREHSDFAFPPFLVREDWPDSEQEHLCKSYIERQAPRLLMLQSLTDEERDRLELCSEAHATEVARLCRLYPSIVNKQLIDALRVEARLRASSNTEEVSKVQNRRDGILYI
ncbi:MAG: hypothetical protein KTR35_07225 [Gammaproteobacteria bacterium]|nr:hypothetical protein [Gammaproteobacteria bacterium]